MKKTNLLAFSAAAAALLALASPSRAGILNLTSGPTFTPNTSFSNNTIMADTTISPDLIHISGAATVVPDASNMAAIDLAGTYDADAGDKFSVAYSFTVDLNIPTPVSYTLDATVVILGTPVHVTSTGMLMPGLHKYEGTAESPVFPVPAVAGSFSTSLTLDFSGVNAAILAAAEGTLDLSIEQLDLRLDPTAATVEPPSEPQNLSTRGNVGTGDNVLIGGFIITGNDSKLVVLRAIGPSIDPMVVSDLLLDPVLELHDSTGAIIAMNDNWMENSAADQQVLTDNNLAPTDDAESALVETLAPGEYTAIVRGAGDTTGVALVESYDLDNGTTDSKLANFSTRGEVGINDDVLIAGFIGGNGGFSEIIVRGLGPSLSDTDVSDKLADPFLELHDANGNVLDANDNWMDNPNMQTISDKGLALSDENEAALYEILLPGKYTAILSGANSTSGVGLVEVYNTDQ